ncbi:MAG: hypothetical protein WB699_11645 [Bacteroidota bacterium]
MSINEIVSSGSLPVDPLKKSGGGGNGKKGSEVKDRADVSSAARSLLEADKQKKLAEVQARVESGFYNQPDVLAKIAEEVLKDLRNLPTG